MAGVDFTRINTNIAALNTLNSLRNVNKNLALHQGRLASGKRINEAADDPAGLTLATKLQVRSDGLQQATDNIGDAKNLLSVAEGGLTKINDILGKMRVKAEQAASDTLGADERTAIKSQLDQFALEIDDIVKQTKWNGNKLLDGSMDDNFQTGADQNEFTNFKLAQNHDSASLAVKVNLVAAASASTVASATAHDGVTDAGTAGLATPASGTTNTELASGEYKVVFKVVSGATSFQLQDSNGIAVKISGTSDGTGALSDDWIATGAAAGTFDTGRGLTIDLDPAASVVDGDIALVNYSRQAWDVSNNANANSYLGRLDSAITSVSDSLNALGSMVARLGFKEENLATAKVNTDASHSRIMDADMAQEQLDSVKFGILQQTATSMLAQTNQAPQSVMQLFR